MKIETEKPSERTHEVDSLAVYVKCLGIACPTGFQLDPVGYAPGFVTFIPGEFVMMAKHYADYLVGQDKARFVVRKNKTAETVKS